jgi:hypothetical protein
MQHYVEAMWPTPQPQIDWLDQVITVEQWLIKTLGPRDIAWSWAVASRMDRICVYVTNPSHVTLVKLRFS